MINFSEIYHTLKSTNFVELWNAQCLSSQLISRSCFALLQIWNLTSSTNDVETVVIDKQSSCKSGHDGTFCFTSSHRSRLLMLTTVQSRTSGKIRDNYAFCSELFSRRPKIAYVAYATYLCEPQKRR